MNINKTSLANFEQDVLDMLKLCRPGDLEHAQRVVKWVNRLASDRKDWFRLVKTAYVHDLGWYKIAPNQKLTKKQLKELEPQANENSKAVISAFLKNQGETEQEISEILRLVQAADEHASSTADEAIIVDADNLSKLDINHVTDKYKKTDWLGMLDLWKETFSQRIKTDLGKELYPGLLQQLEKDIKEHL